jgi:hypothetical protein
MSSDIDPPYSRKFVEANVKRGYTVDFLLKFLQLAINSDVTNGTRLPGDVWIERASNGVFVYSKIRRGEPDAEV